MKPSAVLVKAKKLIESGWSRNAWAETAKGKIIPERTDDQFSFNSPDAAKFCALGAIYRAGGIKAYPEYGAPHVAKSAERYLEIAIGTQWVADWNNRQASKKPVVDAFDRAIKLAKSEGQ